MKTAYFSLGMVGALLLGLGVSHAAPGNRNARIEVVGSWSSDQVNLDVEAVEGGKATPANWASADPAKHVLIEYPANPAWKQASFTFRPHKSGRVALVLMGSYIRTNPQGKELYPVVVAYDEVQVEGATLQNGSFEEVGADGAPAGWKITNSPESQPPIAGRLQAAIITDNPSQGEKCARVWHNSRMSQVLQVEADKPVTVTFMYRLVE